MSCQSDRDLEDWLSEVIRIGSPLLRIVKTRSKVIIYRPEWVRKQKRKAARMAAEKEETTI